MGEFSENLPNKPKEMGSSNSAVRGSWLELPSTDRKECAGMEWYSFQTLNKSFQIEGQEGCWIETKKDSCASRRQVGELNPFYGKHHTEEARLSMSKSHTGLKFSEEHKINHQKGCKEGKSGDHMKGRKDSEQTRRNKSEAAKRAWERRKKLK